MTQASAACEIDWSFAARRLASGQRAVEVAAMFRVEEARMLALLEDPAFVGLLESYRAKRAQAPEERAEARKFLIEDALDWLIEQRNVRAVLWAANRSGIVGNPGKGEQSRGPRAAVSMAETPFAGPVWDEIDCQDWDQVFQALPKALQEDYQEFDPSYVPPTARGTDVPPTARGDGASGDPKPVETTVEQAAPSSPAAGDGTRQGANDNRTVPDAQDVPNAQAAPNNDRSPTFTYWRKEPLPPHFRARGP